jgi:hypothetical protein
MKKLKERPILFNDITIPRVNTARKTIYFDESGEEKMPNAEISFNSSERFFIYTGVIFNNYDVQNLEEHYFNLKRKYFNRIIEIHSTEFFRLKNERKTGYIKSLADFLDTLPFLYITVIVDKKKMFDKSSIVKIRNPKDTTFKKALSICISKGLSKKEFFNTPTLEILQIISEHTIRNVNNYRPLSLAYGKILEEYFFTFCKKLYKTTYKDYENIKPLTQLKFETSPNKSRILKYTEALRNKETDLGMVLINNIYDVSFPFKKARYMGLEIADMISYGYHLQKYKRLSMTPLYAPIRRVILRRSHIVETELGIRSVLEI